MKHNLLLEFLHFLDQRGDLMLQGIFNNSRHICKGDRDITISYDLPRY
jgi:hypothetical protein